MYDRQENRALGRALGTHTRARMSPTMQSTSQRFGRTNCRRQAAALTCLAAKRDERGIYLESKSAIDDAAARARKHIGRQQTMVAAAAAAHRRRRRRRRLEEAGRQPRTQARARLTVMPTAFICALQWRDEAADRRHDNARSHATTRDMHCFFFTMAENEKRRRRGVCVQSAVSNQQKKRRRKKYADSRRS